MPSESRTTRPTSHRRRFLIGVAVAALLGVGLGALLLAGTRTSERRDRAERRALVTLSALTAILDRTSGGSAQEAAPTEAAQPPAEGNGMGLGAEIAAVEQGQASTSTDARGEAVRKAVQSFAAAHPQVGAIRVIEFEGVQLTASTAPSDQGAEAAPRRLEPNYVFSVVKDRDHRIGSCLHLLP